MLRFIFFVLSSIMTIAAAAQDDWSGAIELNSFDQQIFTLRPDGSFKAADGRDFVIVQVPDADKKMIAGHFFLAYGRNSEDASHCYHNTEYKEAGDTISISGTSVDLSKTFFVEAISYTVRFVCADGFIKIYAPSDLSVEKFSDFPKYITWKHYFRKDGSVNPKMQSRHDEINSRLNLVCVAAPLAAVMSLQK